MENTALFDDTDSLQRHGLLVERCQDGRVRTNVRHLRYHSPDGFEIGYGGSGPADLALSVLHALLPPITEKEEEAQYDLDGAAFDAVIDDMARWAERIGLDRVRVNRLALRLHQQFKQDFIARMPPEGGHVPLQVILDWIEAQKKTLEQQNANNGTA